MKRPDAQLLARLSRISKKDRQVANHAATLPLIIPPVEWVNEWRTGLEGSTDKVGKFTTAELHELSPFDEYCYMSTFDNELGRQYVYSVHSTTVHAGILTLLVTDDRVINLYREGKDLADFHLYEIMCFFTMVEGLGRYPVEVIEKDFKPHPIKKMQWKKPSGPRILYLNSLPSQHTESKGGTHAPPKGHIRRAHTKTLRAERFKNHPLYGVKDGIKIKPAWVGPETEEYEGNIYTVKLQSTAK